MSIAEIRAAINFGKEVFEHYKETGEQVPIWMVERFIELYEQLAEALSVGEEA